ncbi:TetR family transcriptional regulator C-terminal domain-containing protein [Actinosynnema sp. NPDC050436]|uniref:TetR/AcrR family transcriptional regulator n=1 Tax=Actinosynnema sp. NPDC050436 TaxID=3155659 RepID=UPI0033F255C0
MARLRGLGAHHEQRRDDIASAVLEVVADSGLAAVSLSSVAARAGISQGRVQHYFPTKEALLEAAFDHANARSAARIRAELGEEAETAPPRQALTVVLTELIPHDAQSANHLRVRQAFAALALHREAIADRMRGEYERLHHHHLADLVRRDQAASALPHDLDAADTALSLVALAEGLAYHVLIGTCPGPTARRLVREAVDRLYS